MLPKEHLQINNYWQEISPIVEILCKHWTIIPNELLIRRQSISTEIFCDHLEKWCIAIVNKLVQQVKSSSRRILTLGYLGSRRRFTTWEGGGGCLAPPVSKSAIMLQLACNFPRWCIPPHLTGIRRKNFKNPTLWWPPKTPVFRRFYPKLVPIFKKSRKIHFFG